LKLKINVGTKLSHFDTWHNCEVTRVKNKNKKSSKNLKKLKNSKKPKIDTRR